MADYDTKSTVKSLAGMLGWSNIPPRETLERSLSAERQKAQDEIEFLKEELADEEANTRQAVALTKELAAENERLKKAIGAELSVLRTRGAYDRAHRIEAFLTGDRYEGEDNYLENEGYLTPEQAKKQSDELTLCHKALREVLSEVDGPTGYKIGLTEETEALCRLAVAPVPK